MPLLVRCAAAWIGGLLLAFHGAPLWLVVFVAGIIAAFAARGSDVTTHRAAPRRGSAVTAPRWQAAFPMFLLFVAADAVGDASMRRLRACATALARDSTWRVVIDERLPSRGSVTAEVRGDGAYAGCAVRARVARAANPRAQPPPIPAGSELIARGAALRTDRGALPTLRIELRESRAVGIDPLRATRGALGDHIDRLFGEDAALVRALLIADQDGIDPATRDRFADAGLVHMLSISGLHVAIVAGALLVVASAARIPHTIASALALAAVTAYVLLLGAPAPAVRSAVMLAVVSLTELGQRPVHPWTSLALGAIVPTIDPLVVGDLGWQLSVSGMASLVAARALLRRLRLTPPRLPTRRDARRAHPMLRRFERRWRRARSELVTLDGWRWFLLREIVTGVIATAVTAPLIAWTFGRVSIVAPIANIVAGPVVAFLQPLLFLALVCIPIDAVATFVAGASRAPILLLDAIATVAAAVPMASLRLTPTLPSAIFAALASVAFVRASASRRMTSGFIVSAAAMVLALWAPLVVPGTDELQLHTIDVGQGDALALRTPRGRWIVVDAGRTWEGGDAGRRTVVPYLRRFGGDVVLFVLSHPHDDHVGGASSVIQALRPRRWWEAAFVTPSRAYESALVSVRDREIPFHRVRPGDAMRIDGVRLEVLAPDSAWTAMQHDANETSVVVRASFGKVSFLLTGDAEGAEERWMVERYGDALRADVLKLGHHGSRTSTTEPFLDAVRPRIAIAPVGAGNRYGHPSPETLARLAAEGIPVLRTDVDGSVIVSTDGTAIWATVRGERWRLPPRRGAEGAVGSGASY